MVAIRNPRCFPRCSQFFSRCHTCKRQYFTLRAATSECRRNNETCQILFYSVSQSYFGVSQALPLQALAWQHRPHEIQIHIQSLT